MSSNEDTVVHLGGMNIKEWSLLILIAALAIVFITWSIAFSQAIANNPNITIEGTIDVGQLTGVLIGIAAIAAVLISQKLTTQQTLAAVRSTDEVWLAEDGSKPAVTKP